MAQEPDELTADDKLAQLKMESDKAQEEAEAQRREAEGAAPEPTIAETRADGNVVWSDGVVTDGDGNTIEAEAPVVTERAEPRARTERKAAEPRTATASAPLIYTREATEAAIYNDDALNEIADIQLTDPVRASRMQAKLQSQLNDALDRLRVHARKTFNAQLTEYARSAPEVVKEFRDDISEYRDSLTPEQMQSPGIAAEVVGRIMAQNFARDPLDAEEAYMRFVKGRDVAPKVDSTLPAPAPTAKRVIPPSERTPGPGTATRQPTRRAVPQTRDSLAEKHRQRYPKDLYPNVTDEECVQWANSMREIEAEAQRQRRF